MEVGMNTQFHDSYTISIRASGFSCQLTQYSYFSQLGLHIGISQVHGFLPLQYLQTDVRSSEVSGHAYNIFISGTAAVNF